MVPDHLDACTELRPGVIGGCRFAALGFEISDAVGAVWELEDEISGAGNVAAEAVGHEFRADHRDPIPEGMGQDGVDPIAVLTRGRWREVRWWVGVEALVHHHFEGEVSEFPAWFPDVLLGHDLVDLFWGLGDR